MLQTIGDLMVGKNIKKKHLPARKNYNFVVWSVLA
jgi:hypothetical protein